MVFERRNLSQYIAKISSKVRGVASGEFFVSLGDPFNFSYGFRGSVRVWTFSLTTRSDTHALITHPFLGIIFLLTSLSINPPSGVDD